VIVYDSDLLLRLTHTLNDEPIRFAGVLQCAYTLVTDVTFFICLRRSCTRICYAPVKTYISFLHCVTRVLCDDSVRWTVCLTTSENVAVFGNGGDLKLVHKFELLDSCCKHLSLHFFKLPVMQQSHFSQKVHSAPFYHTQIMTDNCWCPVTEVTTGAFKAQF